MENKDKNKITKEEPILLEIKIKENEVMGKKINEKQLNIEKNGKNAAKEAVKNGEKGALPKIAQAAKAVRIAQATRIVGISNDKAWKW